MDGLPISILFSSNVSSFATIWTRLFDSPANGTSTAYIGPAATSAEIMISFYDSATASWSPPAKLTNNNQFDGAAVAAVFSPPSNPLPNLLVVWIHKAVGSLVNQTTSSDVMYKIYNSSGVWSEDFIVSIARKIICYYFFLILLF